MSKKLNENAVVKLSRNVFRATFSIKLNPELLDAIKITMDSHSPDMSVTDIMNYVAYQYLSNLSENEDLKIKKITSDEAGHKVGARSYENIRKSSIVHQELVSEFLNK